MATFSTDAELKGYLRLSGMPTTGDGERMFQKAVLRASIAFRKALGEGAVALIAGSSALIQDQARLIEYDLVLCELVKTMPYASLDGSAGMDSWFDKEAPFRHLDEGARQGMIERTCGDAMRDLSALAADLGINYTADEQVSCFVIEDSSPSHGCCP